jgi:Iron/zinc purple acid phosphatase-like protein C
VQIFEKVHLWRGFSRMHANATHLKIEAVTNLDGSVFDTLTLSKPEGWGEQWHQQHGASSDGPGSYTMVCALPFPKYSQNTCLLNVLL